MDNRDLKLACETLDANKAIDATDAEASFRTTDWRKSGYGYRLFHVTKDGLRQEFVRTREVASKTRKPVAGKP